MLGKSKIGTAHSRKISNRKNELVLLQELLDEFPPRLHIILEALEAVQIGIERITRCRLDHITCIFRVICYIRLDDQFAQVSTGMVGGFVELLEQLLAFETQLGSLVLVVEAHETELDLVAPPKRVVALVLEPPVGLEELVDAARFHQTRVPLRLVPVERCSGAQQTHSNNRPLLIWKNLFFFSSII